MLTGPPRADLRRHHRQQYQGAYGRTTKKVVVVSVGSETTPLRPEEDEEYEEAEVTKVEAPAIEPPKHIEKPVEDEVVEKSRRSR
jgi:hypothetical protein